MTEPEGIAAFEACVKTCKTHLDKSANPETLEPLIVRLLIIDACAAYEKTIQNAVNKMAERLCEPESGRYVKTLFEKFYRSSGTTRTLLATLNHMYKDEFENSVSKGKTDAYRNLVAIRNKVAHGGHTDIGMDKVVEMHNRAKVVPCVFAAILERKFRGLPLYEA